MKRFAGIVVVLMVASAGVLPVAVTAGAAISSTVSAGGHLGPGEAIYGGEVLPYDSVPRFELIMQGDGNVVLYDRFVRQEAGRTGARWWTGTEGHPGARLEVQRDGNLVVYTPDGGVLWASNTAGRAGQDLVVQADSNVVFYGTDGVIWSSATDDPTFAPEPGKMRPGDSLSLYRDCVSPTCPGASITSPNGVFSFRLQPDANLVLYKDGRIPLWSTGPLPGALAPMSTFGVNATEIAILTLSLRYSGELVVLGSGCGDPECLTGPPVLWSTHTSARMPHLHVQNDGNVVLYAYDVPVWQTGTAGR